MPQVPYTPYPTEQPSGGGLPALRIPEPAEAFGAGVAKAIEHLGTMTEQAGNELFNRALAIQQVRNKAEADDAFSDYTEQAGKRQAQYRTLEGEAAVKGYDGYMADLRSLREQVGQRLTNSDARRIYNSNSRGFLARETFSAAVHSGNEQKNWAIGASISRIKAASDEAANHLEDPGAFGRAMQIIEQEVRGTLAPLKGWGPDQTNEEVRKWKGTVAAIHAINTSYVDPVKAEALKEQYRQQGYFTEQQLAHTEGVIRGQTHQTWARETAVRNGASDETVPIEKVIGAIDKEADEKFPNDPVAKTYGEQQAYYMRNRLKQVKEERRQDNIQIVGDAINKGGPNGEKPIVIEQVYTADPASRQAFANLSLFDQRRFLKVLESNAKGDRYETPERFSRYQELRGELADAPKTFIQNHDIADILGEDLPNNRKDTLINLWRKTRAGQELDPRVGPIMNWIKANKGAELMGMNVIKSDSSPASPTAYNSFVGALSIALDVWRQDHEGKAPVTNKELDEVATTLVRKETQVGGFGDWLYRHNLGDWRSSTGILDRPMTDAWKEAKQKEVVAKYGRQATDEELQREWIRQQLVELWGKSKSEGPPK